MTDVDGLYKDFSDKDSLISNLTLDEVNEMLYGGEVDKGMIPKLRAAVDALTGGVFRATSLTVLRRIRCSWSC